MPVAYAQKSNNNEVCLEGGRISTFTKWPHGDDGPCARERMAKAGFFYSGDGQSDEVKCFVCLVKLENWDSEQDDPWQKHQEHSKNCLFATLGKEEGSLTVEQWCDVICNRTINILDRKYNKVLKALQ